MPSFWQCSTSFLVAIAFWPSFILGHNVVICTNAFPDLAGLQSTRPRLSLTNPHGTCKGYPRAFPAPGTHESSMYSDQGYPWQGIWPVSEPGQMASRRVCNWLAEDPIYDPASPPAKVKPGSTILVEVQTNNHAHEYADRYSGHHKIFLAGASGMQLKTQNQLTFDRVVAHTPANKYAHILGTPVHGGYNDDLNSNWIPLKLMDPAGNWLPVGTYNYVFTYYWTSLPDSNGTSSALMLPSYTSCFDVIISNDGDDGALTNCVSTDSLCHVHSIGNSSSPGAKDLQAPWPPYHNSSYLFTNYEGDDPSTPTGKKTYQPYYTKSYPADPAPALRYQTTPSISSYLASFGSSGPPRLNVTLGTAMPVDPKYVTSMQAGPGPGLAIKQTYVPMSV